ncbi:hypothetical protein LEP48_15105 [Isoptericola sp. NEAU-Y5]|uniref:Secreted protein n=1 Tax=Isoptericola luteus TaxID=2879484 RepID=A0ABS7ZJW5_9MICO|nr:hypothetical protein [Isoptericola sp. NEAU-Y5]MCA5894666.1 hypothetical protein [Isoptericola sp. NEAU-Y5]
MTRRLFWVGVGVVVTVVVIQRGRKVVAQYAPEAVVERAERAAQDAGRRAETFLGAFRGEFTEARRRREAELTAALLAEGQPDPEDVRASGLSPRDVRAGTHPRHAARAPRDPQAEIDADEAELGYSF